MRFIIGLCFILALTLSLPNAATAQQGGPSLDEVVKQIKNESKVRVLSAERVTVDGRSMFRIKVLTNDGRVKYIWVNAGG